MYAKWAVYICIWYSWVLKDNYDYDTVQILFKIHKQKWGFKNQLWVPSFDAH